LQDVCALFGEQAKELRLLARLQDQDAVAGKPMNHDGSQCPIQRDLFILILSDDWRKVQAMIEGSEKSRPMRNS
jgi:hypothetical protein